MSREKITNKLSSFDPIIFVGVHCMQYLLVAHCVSAETSEVKQKLKKNVWIWIQNVKMDSGP